MTAGKNAEFNIKDRTIKFDNFIAEWIVYKNEITL